MERGRVLGTATQNKRRNISEFRKRSKKGAEEKKKGKTRHCEPMAWRFLRSKTSLEKKQKKTGIIKIEKSEGNVKKIHLARLQFARKGEESSGPRPRRRGNSASTETIKGEKFGIGGELVGKGKKIKRQKGNQSSKLERKKERENCPLPPHRPEVGKLVNT